MAERPATAEAANGTTGASGIGWIVPAPYDGTPASLAEHAAAIAAMTDGGASLWLGPFAPPPALPAGFVDAALVVPTSGSTGSAKAVVLSLAALTASHDATASALGGHGLWLPLLPPTHIAGVQIIARACRSARVLGLPGPALPEEMPDLSGHFDAAAFAAAAEPAHERAAALGLPAYTSLVPTQLSRLLGDDTETGCRALDLLAGFAAVLVGGAATPPALLEAARAAGIAVRTTYGSSETAGGCMYDGVPLEGVELSLENAGSDDDAAGVDHDGDAAAGRLLIASPTLALGLLRPDGTADLSPFRALPDGGRVLVTSDLAALDGGGSPGTQRLRIIGRADDVVITGGRKVLPQDVERAIDAAPALHGLVADRVVVGVPDPEWGARLVALVVPSSGADPALLPAAVPAALRDMRPHDAPPRGAPACCAPPHGPALPRHAVPKATLVVGALPLRGIGKIDRSAARDLAIALGA